MVLNADCEEISCKSLRTSDERDSMTAGSIQHLRKRRAVVSKIEFKS